MSSFIRLPLKILVVGTSCSGKSTFALTLSNRLAVKHIDLDELFWRPGWKLCSDETCQALITEQVLCLDNWIVSGNYTTKGRDTIWKEATYVIWLNFPLRVILRRYVLRTARRILYKEPCCNGNIETLRSAIFSKENLLIWILRTYASRRRQYRYWMHHTYREKHWIELKDQRDANALLDSSEVVKM